MPTGSKSSIGTSAVQLTTRNIVNRNGITIKAAAGNSGKVFIGDGNYITPGNLDGYDGYELSAKDSVTLPRSRWPNAASVWLIASGAGQQVFFEADGEEVV